MSTRSGKRIHMSFHENTVKSEAEITRSERKTRSKFTKENCGERIAIPKKQNYVAYPSDAETPVSDDTVGSHDEGRTIRVLRKNTLKERNFPSSTENVEPAVESRKPVQSTRKTRKFAKSEVAEAISKDFETVNVEVSNPKKGKKKKAKHDQVMEVDVPKKKSKKKKGRRSNSIVVEDNETETLSSLNKSNMSVDSFHSAAGSPWNTDNCDEPALPPVEDMEQDIDTMNITFETNDETEARKTRSTIKLHKTSKNGNSSVKVNLDGSLDATFEKDECLDDTLKEKSRKSSIKDVATVASEDMKDETASTFNIGEMLNSSTRKSMRHLMFDKTLTPDKSNGKVLSDNKGKKNKSIVDETFDVNEDLKSTAVEENDVSMTYEKLSEVIEAAGKKRKSAVNIMITMNEKPNTFKSSGKAKRKSIVNETFDKDLEVDVTEDKKKTIMDATFGFENSSPCKLSPIILFAGDAKINVDDTTFDKDSETDFESSQEPKRPIVDTTIDLASSSFKSANELTPMDSKSKSVIDTTYDKDSDTDQETNKRESIFEKETVAAKMDTTFDKDTTEIKESVTIENKRKSLLRLSSHKVTDTVMNSSFDYQDKKLETTSDKNKSLISSDSSMITLDKSDDSSFSISSDESRIQENNLNTTPLLIESSLEESPVSITQSPKTESAPHTPLKREGTFTKDEPEVMSSPKLNLSKTPTKNVTLEFAGFTPFHNRSSSKEKVLLNVTRSIEKRWSSMAEPPRSTKVMFCSPVNNPAVVSQIKRKVIKSNLKGSNKSFVFDDSVSVDPRPAPRKRSYTQSDADDTRAKRKRLADGLQQSVDRLSRPRTSSASAKLAELTTPSKKTTIPSKNLITPSKKSDARLSRTKLPNFAALHQKQFDKMESLDECQERRAKRAKQLLTPTGALNMLERISPKDNAVEPEKPNKAPETPKGAPVTPKKAPRKPKEVPEKPKEAPKKPETPIKSLPTFKSLNPGYTRFGFKLNLDTNPFSIPSNTHPKPKGKKPNGLNSTVTLPSLAGATSARKEVAKQTVMREKSFTDRRNVNRTENRTVIKGVRTNRRFELQMRMRDV